MGHEASGDREVGGDLELDLNLAREPEQGEEVFVPGRLYLLGEHSDCGQGDAII